MEPANPPWQLETAVPLCARPLVEVPGTCVSNLPPTAADRTELFSIELGCCGVPDSGPPPVRIKDLPAVAVSSLTTDV